MNAGYEDFWTAGHPDGMPADPPAQPRTIADWERERADAWAQLVTRLTPDPTDEVTVECLRSRSTAGLGVQLLWLGGGKTAITVTLNGETETFDVHPHDANEAFEHPYAYGATLPL